MQPSGLIRRRTMSYDVVRVGTTSSDVVRRRTMSYDVVRRYPTSSVRCATSSVVSQCRATWRTSCNVVQGRSMSRRHTTWSDVVRRGTTSHNVVRCRTTSPTLRNVACQIRGDRIRNDRRRNESTAIDKTTDGSLLVEAWECFPPWHRLILTTTEAKRKKSMY